MNLSASFRGLHLRGKMVLLTPTDRSVIAWFELEANWSLPLGTKKGESFKPVALSSMRVSDKIFDASEAMIDDGRVAVPAQGTFPANFPHIAQEFGLVGGRSIRIESVQYPHKIPGQWPTKEVPKNGPSVTIKLDRPMEIMGYVTPSNNQDDDNVSVWANIDGGVQVWSYLIEAT